MSGLEMPKRGESARLLQELNAQHAPDSPTDGDKLNERYNVTTLDSTPEETVARTHEQSNEETNAETNAETKGRTGEPTNGGKKGSAGGRAKPAIQGVGAQTDAPTATPATGTEEERFEAALKRAKDDAVAVVTVRAPERFNTYIDRYVERLNRISPKAKYRKQDAVAEMFAWFYASHPMPPAPADEDDL